MHLADSAFFLSFITITMHFWAVLHCILFLNSFVNSSPENSKCDEENVTCSHDGMVKIFWNLNGLKQEDPKLVEAIKKDVLVPPQWKPLNVSGKPTKYPGQFNQVHKVIMLLDLENPSAKTNSAGFFVEAGASCGENLSNTLYFEMFYGWGGLLVEPNPHMLKLLYQKNRNAWILPHCLSTKPEVEVVTIDASLYVGGIVTDEDELKSSKGDKVQVQCFPLYSVLKAMGNPHVDYFSLDVEGAEYPVLKSIPFDKTKITLVSAETNQQRTNFKGKREDIHKLMEKDYGYKYSGSSTIDDFFLKSSLNRFVPDNKRSEL